MTSKKIPASLKWIFSVFMAILIPSYWINYGPLNFLWVSDVTLILTYLAVMMESVFLVSMAAVSGIALELFWTVDFLFALLFDIHIAHLTDYMFDSALPLWLRLLSLFHIVLPPLILWMIFRLGYSRKAWLVQTPIIWVIIILTWLLTKPSDNVNWVFTYQTEWLNMGAFGYLILELLLVTVIIAITHLVFLGISRWRHFSPKLK